MERRKFLMAASAGMAASVAAPAIVKANTPVRWRMTSSFPKSLDTIYGAGTFFAEQVAALTDGQFQIQVFSAGEIVGGLQALDAVQNGTVEMAHTISTYYTGKDPSFALACTFPFGLNSRQQHAFMYSGGGIELFNEFYKKYNVYGLPCGNTGAQMGGWFRKEVKTPEDFKGLKFRISGIAGQVLAKLGAVPQQIAAGDIYPALERGTIDAAEWIGPYDDEKLGFYRVAPYYYYPGWWEGGPQVHNFINLTKWNELPKQYQAAVTNAAANTTLWMQARYDTQNPAALKRLVVAGAQLRPFSSEVLDACNNATKTLWTEISAQNPEFKQILDQLQQFKDDQYLWWQVAEYGFDSYMIRARNKR